jgi:hypothetical protein
LFLRERAKDNVISSQKYEQQLYEYSPSGRNEGNELTLTTTRQLGHYVTTCRRLRNEDETMAYGCAGSARVVPLVLYYVRKFSCPVL